MYFYEVGYTSCEDSSIIMLLHERSFRKHEFNKMAFECSMEAARTFYAEELINCKELRDSPEIEEDRKYRYDDRCISISFDRIYDSMANLMCEKYGFTKPVIKQRWTAFGWDNLRNPNDWRGWGCNRLQNKISRAIIAEFGRYTDSLVFYKEYKKKNKLKSAT